MPSETGQRPKLELQLNSPMKLKLLRDVHVGENGHGKYYLYSVRDESGQEYAWFAPIDAHEVMQNAGLKSGSEILVSRLPNGRGNGRIEVAILGKAAEPQVNELKDLMIQSMKDASQVVAAVPELGFRAEDARAIGLSIYISKTKQW